MLETITPVHDARARRQHVCMFCGGPINKGSIYQYAVYKYDGVIYGWKNHVRCGDVIRYFNIEGDEGITASNFAEGVDNAYYDMMSEHYNETYESNTFVMPPFMERLNAICFHYKL